MDVSREQSLSERIAAVVLSIPAGWVMSYGQVAAVAGNPLAARQVVRTLKMWSSSRGLPWHRVINQAGRISLPRGGGYDEQRTLLEADGVVFGLDGSIDMSLHRWTGPYDPQQR